MTRDDADETSGRPSGASAGNVKNWSESTKKEYLSSAGHFGLLPTNIVTEHSDFPGSCISRGMPDVKEAHVEAV